MERKAVAAKATPNPADRRTLTEAQIQRTLAMLKHRPRHTYELRRQGISHPAARVMDLVKRGYLITSSRITTVDGDGFTHTRVALYSLAEIQEVGK